MAAPSLTERGADVPPQPIVFQEAIDTVVRGDNIDVAMV
jgi:hypothetical protein